MFLYKIYLTTPLLQLFWSQMKLTRTIKIFKEATMVDDATKINVEVEVVVSSAVGIITPVATMAIFSLVGEIAALADAIKVMAHGSLTGTRLCLVLVHHNNRACCLLLQMGLNNINSKSNINQAINFSAFYWPNSITTSISCFLTHFHGSMAHKCIS